MAAATSPPDLVAPPTRPRAVRQAGVRDLVALFSLAVLVLSALLAALPPIQPRALPVVLVIALAGWAAYRRDRVALLWPGFVLLAVPVAAPWTGNEQSPLLPVLLCGGLTLGISGDSRRLGGSCLASLAVFGAVAAPWNGHFDKPDRSLAIGGVQWLGLAFAVGLVTRWARRLSADVPPVDPYAQARDLLTQLREHSGALSGGLDATGTAAALLERAHGICPHDRSAVVVSLAPGTTTPLAVRGVGRVPWRADLGDVIPLREAWLTGRPQQDTRPTDHDGRRRGSTLLAVPLLSVDGPFGVMVLESFDRPPYAWDTVASVQELADQTASQLESSLLLEEVRLATSTGERDRLAREMHDGIGQELAFLGYRLDELKARAAADVELADAVGDVRSDLTRLIGDLRLSITTMRTTVRPDRGLGQVLGNYLQAVCSGKPIALTLALQESPYRLPADHEVALLTAAQAFAAQVRRNADVRMLDVSLQVDSPAAHLRMSCDVPITFRDNEAFAVSLARLGAIVRFDAAHAGVTEGVGLLDIQLGDVTP